jgi:hypothetical protein
MTQPAVFTQWSTIAPFFRPGSQQGWIPVVDQQRIAAYQQYEEIYWQAEEGMAAVMRGDNDRPVQMPTARTLINTVNRYTAPGFTFRIDGDDTTAVATARLAFETLFKRERFFAKFNGAKRKWLVQGDWFWHVLADPTKPPGSRLSLERLEPGSVFPVYESDVDPEGDPTKLLRVHIAEQVVIENETRVSRLTYEKITADDGTVTIQRSHGIFKLDSWVTSVQPTRVILAPELLPEEITALPVYHLKNFDDTEPFGSSELRGLESVLLGVNQTISDEDLTLAMDGLGVWGTDGGPPVDEQGNEVEWIFGPGRVITNANGLKRLNGVGTVTPYGDHYERLVTAVREALGASDVAVGRVDATTAESGIALLLQLGPILSYTAEKDQTIVDVHTQLFHDLCTWFAVYEELPLLTTTDQGTLAPTILITPIIGAKIPVNRAQVIDEMIRLRSVVPPLVSLSTALDLLRSAGLALADNEAELIDQEQQGILAAGAELGAAQDAADALRAAQEQANPDEGAAA